MSVISYQQMITESAKQLFKWEQQQGKAYLRDRMRFLRLLKTGQCTSQAQAGALLGHSQRSSQRLWKRYREGGIKALLTYPYQGKPCRLSNKQKEQLRCYLTHDGVQFLHEAGSYIAARFGVGYSTSGVCKLFRRMKVKKKTGRPSNYRKDEKGARRFKKSLPPL